MGNILNYLDWRGDISLTERAFNEIDNVILSELAYIQFSGIVPGVEAGGGIAIRDAYAMAYRNDQKVSTVCAGGNSDLYTDLLGKMARSKRFGSAMLSNYVDLYDEQRQTQFAAIQIALDDGTAYIAFRGTDQTIVGWREDFAMSFQVVPAQQEAARYLDKVMSLGNKPYRVGGHSKGGNLAVYAAMMCRVERKERIIGIYNNDGPGLSEEMLCDEGYRAIRHKIHRIVPQFSVIGMLFESDADKQIVRSHAVGVMQHESMTWRVDRDTFVTENDLLPECKAVNQMVGNWIGEVSMEQRRIFTRDFFNALGAGGAKTIKELSTGGIGGFESVLASMANSDKDMKTTLAKLAKSLFLRLCKVDYTSLLKTKSIVRGIGLIFLGLFFMKLPESAIQIIGVAGVFVSVFLLAKRLLYHIGCRKQWGAANRYSMIYGILIALLISLPLLQSAFVLAVHFCLGVFCFIYGICSMWKRFKLCRDGQGRLLGAIVRSGIFILLGIIVLAATGQEMWPYIFVVGTFIIMEGFWEVIHGMYRKIVAAKVF